MSYYFGEQNWPQLEAAIRQKTLVIVPVGTTEEHGRHLPVETDAMIARMFGDAIAEGLLQEGVPVLVTQPVYYGYSMDIVTRWPGCLKIRTRVFMDYIFDMADALIGMGFDKVALLDCHGNHDGLGDIHGGEWETSMILAWRPDLVDQTAYTDVDAIRCNGPLRGPVSTWGLQETKTGLFGDPTYARAELGRACLKAGSEAAVAILRQYMDL